MIFTIGLVWLAVAILVARWFVAPYWPVETFSGGRWHPVPPVRGSSRRQALRKAQALYRGRQVRILQREG